MRFKSSHSQIQIGTYLVMPSLKAPSHDYHFLRIIIIFLFFVLNWFSVSITVPIINFNFNTFLKKIFIFLIYH